MMRISDAELAVMKVIWKKKRATSGEIIQELKDRNWNYNTIRTLIKRLYDKGAVTISDKGEKFYVYIPLVDEKEYKIESTIETLNKLYNNSITEFFLYYCQSDNVKLDEIEKLFSEIKKQRDNLKK